MQIGQQDLSDILEDFIDRNSLKAVVAILFELAAKKADTIEFTKSHPWHSASVALFDVQGKIRV